MFPLNDNRGCAIDKMVIAFFYNDLAGFPQLFQKVHIALQTVFCRLGTCPVEFRADISPSGCNEYIESRMVQETDGKTGGLSEFFKDAAQLFQVY